MPVSEAQKRASAKFGKVHLVTIGVKVSREMSLQFASACRKMGVSRSQVLREAIMSAISVAKAGEKF